VPTLADVAETAAFLASHRAGSMTGTIANVSCHTRCAFALQDALSTTYSTYARGVEALKETYQFLDLAP
jgi:predicted dithiol-disulfide oxidoreductase (DUF899 family)